MRLPAQLSGPAAVAALAIFSCAPEARAQEHDPHEEGGEVEEVIVQATRTGRRVQDEPIRVDVISREEIEEKIMMRPGNVAMLLSETGGLRLQVTSPSLGGSNVRVQGMRGRYTQLLTDGLPLYGGQASSIGLLQIPPTDLGQVEVIKGAASALYGPSALGGVVNLVSRRPSETPLGELLINATTRNGQDVTAYGSAPLTDSLSYSVVGGGHRQQRQDLDSDGWIDMPGYERWTLRPRLFWEGDAGQTGFLTIGAMTENRRGGTLPGRTVADGAPFVEAQDSQRLDGGTIFTVPVGEAGSAQFRASGATQKHAHRFGDLREDDRHTSLFTEGSFSADQGSTNWLIGAAVQRDAFRSKRYGGFDYTYLVPALFVQAEHDLTDEFTLAGSARWDAHDEFGSRLSPRFSMLYRPGPWTLRASVGQGFYAPTPFVEEIEAAGLSQLEPLGDLKEEVATNGSAEIGYARGPVEANVTVFASNIRHAVRLEPVAGPLANERVRLVNAEGDTRTQGAEVLLRYRWDDFTVTGSYVYVDATEPGDFNIGRRTVPLTPKHTAGVVAMWENHERGRVGFEAYYTGRQDLEDNPYRARSRPYVELGLLGELHLGKVSVFINLENLLNVRQTKYDPTTLPRRAPDGRWTVDAWAPTDGFVANGGVRIRFGG